MDHPNRKFETTLIKQVAERLGNTPAVCKSYYIHPKILLALNSFFVEKKQLPEFSGKQQWLSDKLSPSEEYTLMLLNRG